MTRDSTQHQAPTDENDQQQEVDNESIVYYEIELPIWLLSLMAIWFGTVLAVCYLYLLEYNHWADMRTAFGVEMHSDDHANPPMRSLRVSSAQLTAKLGPYNSRLFALLDRDGNGLISIAEYEALVHHVRMDTRHPIVLQATTNSLYPRGTECGLPTDNRACVRLSYRLTPIPVAETDKDIQRPSSVEVPALPSYIRYDPFNNNLSVVAHIGQCANLALKETAAALANFAANGTVDMTVAIDSITLATAFLPRLPQQLDQLRIGEPYTLIGPTPNGLELFLFKQRRMNPGVYFEPGEAALATLLRPLHPNVFLYPRHGSNHDSAAAVVRAESPTHLELAFRLHPELQLAAFGAQRSVYLTPEGLEGRLIIQRDGGQVEHLEIGLPKSADDSGSGFYHVESPHDILETGFVSLPQLSIRSVRQSDSLFSNWTAQLPMSAAIASLRSHMLPHLAAHFHANLSSALDTNRKYDAKPIHVVLAIGSSQFGCDPNCRALRDLAFTDQYVMLRLRHYYTNVWISFADTAALSEFSMLTGAAIMEQPLAVPPLTCLLLHPETLRPLASYQPTDLRKALLPPEGLPNPLPPTPEALAAGAGLHHSRRFGNVKLAPEDHEMPPEDPEIHFQQEQKAMNAIRVQVADSYMQFLMSGKM